MSVPAIDLDALLRRLHLPTVRRLYPELAQHTEQDGVSYREFLALLMAEEVAHRAQTHIQRCVRRAHFPFLKTILKTIEEFDFTFQASVRLALLGSVLGPELVTRGLCLIASGPVGGSWTRSGVGENQAFEISTPSILSREGRTGRPGCTRSSLSKGSRWGASESPGSCGGLSCGG